MRPPPALGPGPLWPLPQNAACRRIFSWYAAQYLSDALCLKGNHIIIGWPLLLVVAQPQVLCFVYLAQRERLRTGFCAQAGQFPDTSLIN